MEERKQAWMLGRVTSVLPQGAWRKLAFWWSCYRLPISSTGTHEHLLSDQTKDAGCRRISHVDTLQVHASLGLLFATSASAIVWSDARRGKSTGNLAYMLWKLSKKIEVPPNDASVQPNGCEVVPDRVAFTRVRSPGCGLV